MNIGFKDLLGNVLTDNGLMTMEANLDYVTYNLERTKRLSFDQLY